MFGNNFTLFEILGFRVRANVSWLFLAVLVTWSLAAGYFPAAYPDLTTATYWWLGIVATIGLFFSLLFHELSHSVVARARGLEIKGITLFLFGGVSEMAMEPNRPNDEFWIAIAGPAASVLLAGVFYGLALGLQALSVPEFVAGVPARLALLNLVLAGFNMVPGFPLDGGRVLRAILWHFKGDLRWATRWATRLGQGFGFLLAALGVVNVLNGNFIAGMWWFLIGLFMHGAATASYQRLIAQQALKTEAVRDVMTPNPVTVPPDISVSRFIEDYLYRFSYDLFPVVAGERLVGCVSLKDVQSLPRDEWGLATVGRIAESCTENNTIRADADAAEALERMQRTGNGRLLVTDARRLVGVLTLKDLLHRLAVRDALERTDRPPG
jgi:Zn-dependent protease/CBS domain-containing protein